MNLRYWPHLDKLIGFTLGFLVIVVPLLRLSLSLFQSSNQLVGLVAGIWVFILATIPFLLVLMDEIKKSKKRLSEKRIDNIFFLYTLLGATSLLLYSSYGPYGYVIVDAVSMLPIWAMEWFFGFNLSELTEINKLKLDC